MSDIATLSLTLQGESTRSAPIDDTQLVAQLGGEVARALSPALERVNTLLTTGRIDKTSLRALRDELEMARRAGIMGQQVARFASGRVKVSNERIDLTGLLREALVQRMRDLDASGLQIRQQFAQAEVMSDATLLFSMIQALLDWALEHALDRIDLSLQVKTWPEHPEFSCAFAHQPADEVVSGPIPLDRASRDSIDTMSWRLVEQIAQSLELRVRREDHRGRARAVIEFPRPAPKRLNGNESANIALMKLTTPDERPLQGRHVLVLSARREIRSLVREAVRPSGVLIDFVATVDGARDFCRGGMPDALVFEAALGGERFDRLRRELLKESPTLAFVQISEQGKTFETLNSAGLQTASVGRDAIISALPAALQFELARCAASAA